MVRPNRRRSFRIALAERNCRRVPDDQGRKWQREQGNKESTSRCPASRLPGTQVSLPWGIIRISDRLLESFP